jgi:type IV protein arginine methyltransferase
MINIVNRVFHEVSCAVAKMDLEELGIRTETEVVKMDSLGDDIWDGIRRRYWTLDTYEYPICRFDLY